MGAAESLTISSKNCNHVNLVKLQKNKEDNTLILDIMSANCAVPSRNHQQSNRFGFDGETQKDIFKFSFVHQLSDSTPSDTPFVDELNIIHGIRFFSLIWIILLNVLTVLSYASSKCEKVFKVLKSILTNKNF